MDEIFSQFKFLSQRIIYFSLFTFLPFVSITANESDKATDIPGETQAATGNIKGCILEKGTGESLIGANVWLKETTTGTITDVEGNFSLTIPNNRSVVLVVSYIGYETLEKVVNPGDTNLVIELSPDSGMLEEVQVIGYGTQRKESIIGSISTVKIDNIKVPTSKISSNLIGQVGGVVSVQRSGEPGTAPEYWIRGISTFGANGSPLILVDGVERSLDFLDPEEIDTFSILKDATATAVYGVRGANGVILITTRRGQEGVPKISIKAETGIVRPTKVPKRANSVDYATMYNELVGYDYYSDDEIEMYRNGSDPDLYPNVDWIDAIFNNQTFNRRITANISGGGSLARYFISGSYYHEDGIFKTNGDSYNANPNYKRYNFRSNIDLNLHPTTVLSLTLGGFLEQWKDSFKKDDIWQFAFVLPPNTFPIQYSNGYYSGINGVGNPYYYIMRGGYNQNWKNTLNTTISLDQDLTQLITPGLKANIKFSFDASNKHTNSYSRGDDLYYTKQRDAEGNLIFGAPESEKWGPSFSRDSEGDNATYLEASISYNRLFNNLHRVGGLVLYNQRVYNKTANSSMGSLPYKNQGLAGRITYDYDSRYFIEGNFGYNGSENFAPGKRVGFFPSGAIGWYVSNEKFFEPITSVVSKLKLKASVGQVGNDKIIQDVRFIYLGTVQGSGSYMYGNYVSRSGERVAEVPNPNVSWEVSTKQNYGFEIGLFDKLEIMGDWYKDTRSNIFVRNNNMPSYIGLSTIPMVNVGKMKSWGFDGSAEYNQQIGEVFISGRATFTYASNKILEYGDADNLYDYMNIKGQKRYQNRGFVALGLFESQDEIDRSPIQFSESIHDQLRPGDIKYKDINGDGIIDDYDKIPIGYADIPEITYGFGASLSWKGIDFSFFLQGTGRVTCFERGTSLSPFTSGYANNDGYLQDVVGNYWSVDNPNPNAKYPRLNDVAYGSNNNTKESTFWQRDASYIRLKNMEIGYTFPKRWMDKAGIRSLRLYLSGVNLWTYAKELKIYDPELGTTDGRKYPPSKVYNIGLNINF